MGERVIPAKYTVALALTHVLALVALVFFFAGSLGVFAELHADGGVFALVVGLIALAQSVVGVLLGRRMLGGEVALPAHLVMPGLAVLLGLVGSVVGLHEAEALVHDSAGDLDWTPFAMWTISAALADVPRLYGLFVAGWGLVAICVTGALSAHVRRGEQRDSPVGVAVGGVLALGAATTIVLVSRWGWVEAATWSVLAPMIGIGVVVVAVLALLARQKDRSRSALDGIALSTLAGALALLSLGYGKADASLRTSMAWTASPPFPWESREAMRAGFAFQQYPAYVLAAWLLAAAVLVPGALLFYRSRQGFGEWLSRRRRSLLAVVLVAAGLAAGQDWYGRFQRAQFAEHVVVTPSLQVPEELTLPASTSEILSPGWMRDVVGVRGGQIWVSGEKVSDADDAARLVTERLTRMDDKSDGRFAKLVLVNPNGEVEQDGPEWRVVLVASDASTRVVEVMPLLDRLVERGAGKAKILVRPVTEKDERNSPEGRRRRLQKAFGDLGVFEDAIAHDQYPWHVINVYAVAGHEPAETEQQPLNLTLGLHDGRWAVGTGALPEPPFETRSLDELRSELEQIKDAHPDEREIYVIASGSTTMQQLVDALDAARESIDGDDWWILFDAVHWLTRPLSNANQ